MNVLPPRIVVVGSSNTDLVLACERLPLPGETLLGGEFQRFQGGKGANQAVAAARAGAKVTFVGARGRDDFGKAAHAALQREGIAVSHFRDHATAPSGVALILLGGRDRENMIGVARSANDTLSVSDIDKAESAFAKAGAVLTQLEVPPAAVRRSAELAGKYGIPFVLNPAPARPLPAALLKKVHTLIPNESEAEMLSGKSDPEKAAAALLRSGPRQVIVTLGSRGALLADARGLRYFKAPKVKPVDTVGAGDCFAAWVTVGIAERLPIEDVIARAIKASAIAVTRAGAQSGMPSRSEI